MLILYWIVLEIFFGLYIYWKVRKLNALPAKVRVLNSEIIFKVLDLVSTFRTYSVKSFIEDFFGGVPLSEIYDYNVLSFLSWSLTNTSYEKLNRSQRLEIGNILDRIEVQYHLKFSSGLNPDIEHIGMSIQPIKYCYQPLCLYAVYWILNGLEDIYLSWNGFQYRDLGFLSYRYRPGLGRPTVFLPGISPGWFTYLRFISKLDGPVYLFNLKCYRIGSLNFDRPSPQQVVDQIINHVGTDFNLIGHSFGTIIATWIIKSYPSCVRCVTLIDPVSILLALPKVASSFIYQHPKSFFHKCIRFFAAREITIAHSLFRNFDWQHNMLWIENLTMPHLISLSLDDEIIPGHTIQEYLNNDSHLYWRNLSHCQSISSHNCAIKTIHERIQNFSK